MAGYGACIVLVIIALVRHGWQQSTQAGVFNLIFTAPVATLILLLSSALEPRKITVVSGMACGIYVILLVVIMRWLLKKVRNKSIGTGRLLDMLMLLWLPVALMPRSSTMHVPGARVILFLIIILRLPLTLARLQKKAAAGDVRRDSGQSRQTR
jgi:hypothetical protein